MHLYIYIYIYINDFGIFNMFLQLLTWLALQVYKLIK
jgi:hypothetical protein